MSAVYSIYTSPNHAPIPNHLPTLIVTPHGQPHHTLYSYIHTNYNKETYLLTPSPQGDLCVAKMVPPPGSRGPRTPGQPAPDTSPSADRSVRCEASRNLKWSITNTGIHAPVYKLTLPNPDQPGTEQPLFQISKPNPKANFWTMFYFTYAGHLIPPRRVEFGKIQKNAAAGAGANGQSASGGGGGTRVTITGKTPEEKAVWQTLGEGNEDMVEWIVLCAALNVLDDEILKAAEKHSAAIAASSPTAGPSRAGGAAAAGAAGGGPGPNGASRLPGARLPPSSSAAKPMGQQRPPQPPPMAQQPARLPGAVAPGQGGANRPGGVVPSPAQPHQQQMQRQQPPPSQQGGAGAAQGRPPMGMPQPPAMRGTLGNVSQRPGAPATGGGGAGNAPSRFPAPQGQGQGRGMPMPGGPRPGGMGMQQGGGGAGAGMPMPMPGPAPGGPRRY